MPTNRLELASPEFDRTEAANTAGFDRPLLAVERQLVVAFNSISRQGRNFRFVRCRREHDPGRSGPPLQFRDDEIWRGGERMRRIDQTGAAVRQQKAAALAAILRDAFRIGERQQFRSRDRGNSSRRSRRRAPIGATALSYLARDADGSRRKI